jgi:hypothetical protein
MDCKKMDGNGERPNCDAMLVPTSVPWNEGIIGSDCKTLSLAMGTRSDLQDDKAYSYAFYVRSECTVIQPNVPNATTKEEEMVIPEGKKAVCVNSVTCSVTDGTRASNRYPCTCGSTVCIIGEKCTAVNSTCEKPFVRFFHSKLGSANQLVDFKTDAFKMWNDNQFIFRPNLEKPPSNTALTQAATTGTTRQSKNIFRVEVKGGACGSFGVVVQFRVNDAIIDYFRDGKPSGWQPLEDVKLIRGSSDKLPRQLFTGGGSSRFQKKGWILSSKPKTTQDPSDIIDGPQAFASSFSCEGCTEQTAWDVCNANELTGEEVATFSVQGLGRESFWRAGLCGYWIDEWKDGGDSLGTLSGKSKGQSAFYADPDFKFADGIAEVEFMMTKNHHADSGEQGGGLCGLVFRSNGVGKYYAAYVDQGLQSFHFYAHDSDDSCMSRTRIKSPLATGIFFNVDEWHSIKVKANGNAFTFYYDGKKTGNDCYRYDFL